MHMPDGVTSDDFFLVGAHGRAGSFGESPKEKGPVLGPFDRVLFGG